VASPTALCDTVACELLRPIPPLGPPQTEAQAAQVGFEATGFRHGAQHASVASAAAGELAPKVSLMFRIYDKPGALVDVLSVFAKHGISLTRIESKPTKAR